MEPFIPSPKSHAYMRSEGVRHLARSGHPIAAGKGKTRSHMASNCWLWGWAECISPLKEAQAFPKPHQYGGYLVPAFVGALVTLDYVMTPDDGPLKRLLKTTRLLQEDR